MERFKDIKPKDIFKGAGIFGATTALALATALLPHPAQAGEGITLTPPEGSVTPGASGRVNVEVLLRNSDDLVELLINGELNSLVPGRSYKVWACWDSEYDCSTNANPEIRTGPDGSVSFNGLQFTIFDRPQHPITSLQVREETSGEIPSDACYVGAIPCLRAPFSVRP